MKVFPIVYIAFPWVVTFLLFLCGSGESDPLRLLNASFAATGAAPACRFPVLLRDVTGLKPSQGGFPFRWLLSWKTLKVT